MSPRNLLWVAVPIALSVGVIWLSAQESKAPPAGVKVGEMAEKVQARERAVVQKEAELSQLQRRLNTLQATLMQEREQILAREKAIDEEKAKIKEAKDQFEVEKTKEMERLKELEKSIELERQKEVVIEKVDDQLIKTYEAMDPIAASKALKELTSTNADIAVGLLAAMQPKKAAKILDQLANDDAKLTGVLSERVGKRQKENGKPKPGAR